MDDSDTENTAEGASQEEVNAAEVINDLVRRAKVLLSELEHFRQRLRGLRQEANVELGHFRGTVNAELKMLERLGEKTAPNRTTVHVARSSNLPFLETLWSNVKRSRDITAIQKRIYTYPAHKLRSHGMRHVENENPEAKQKGSKEASVVVDAVTDAGRTWTKVSLVTNSRLLFDLAKQGWESGGSDFEDDDERTFKNDDDDDRDVPILKTAKELTNAANCFRVRTKTPTVHMVLPRIKPGETPEVDAILENCRAAGAILFCGTSSSPTPPIDEALQTMAPDPFESFPDVINIDCTILLALVSEFSHAKVSKQPWFHRALKRQVEIEDNENLLPSLLYPAMGSHKLVCTHEAAKRMREIVSKIGTPSEKARTAVLFDALKSRSELLGEMQEWSAYAVPDDWQLPIKIVDQDENGCQSLLPPQALQVSKDMTAINQSVFLYGWATGRTTITSNRTVVKQLETDLEQFDGLDDDVWPRIWLCPTARSLVGKEKRGAKKEGQNGSAWPLPDPLRREAQRRNGLDVLSIREGHEVEDLRPNGYPCEEVLAAKNASQR